MKDLSHSVVTKDRFFCSYLNICKWAFKFGELMVDFFIYKLVQRKILFRLLALITN